MAEARARRSCLAVPASSPKMLAKAPGLAADEVFLDLEDMVEDDTGLPRRIGIEAQIETASGLMAIREIASSSPRLETLIFGPGDMAASLGSPSVSIGESSPAYPGDQWHWVLETILVAARAAGLQAIDGPFGRIRDLAAFRASAARSYALGYDGKWVLHPDQIGIANEVFTPGQHEFDRALALLEAYQQATREQSAGAVSFGNEMIDEASRKMAQRLAVRGRAAGLSRRKTLADFQAEWRQP